MTDLPVCHCKLCKKFGDRRYLLYIEVAKDLLVHVNTVRNYIDQGLFKSVTISKGNRRVLFESYHAFTKERDNAIEENEPKKERGKSIPVKKWVSGYVRKW